MSGVDLDAARRWVEVLTGNAGAVMHWQTFDDSKAKRKQLGRGFEGSLDQVQAELAELQARGAGVFACVNGVEPGQPRQAKYVRSVRALFIDHDEKDGPLKADPMTARCKPSMVVKSGGGRHYFWLVRGCSVEDFNQAQRQLIAFYGSDKSIHDLPRVMRVPGFVHQKGEPTAVAIESSEAASYGLEMILAAHPVVDDVEDQPSRRSSETTASQSEAMKRARAWIAKRDPAIQGNGGDNHTYATTCHLLDFGLNADEALDLLYEWNERCQPKWSDRQLQSKVRSAMKSRQNSGGVKLDEGQPLRYEQRNNKPSQPPTPAGGSEDPPDRSGGLGLGSSSMEPSDLAESELLISQLLLKWYGEDLRYCFDEKLWYVWDGKCFQPDERSEIMELGKKTVLRYAADLQKEHKDLVHQAAELDDKDEAKKLRGMARKLESEWKAIQKLNCIEHAIELAKSHPQVRVSKNDFDADYDLLNAQNGVINLLTGKLLPHDRKYLHARICSVEYDPSYTSTDLDKVVDNVANNDAGTKRYMQQSLGATLLGNNRFEEFYLISGAARCGKGTLFEAIKGTLGAYCVTSEFTTWLNTNQPRIRDDLAGLQGARMVLSSEVEKGSVLSASVMKSATGNDTIRVRHLYGRYFEYRPTYTIWLQSNARPKLDRDDEGMWGRLRNVHVPEHRSLSSRDRDPDLKKRLMDPKQGGKAILAWMVQGCIQVAQAREIIQPQAVIDAARHYRDDQDALRDFLLDCLRFSSSGDKSVFVPNKDLALAYERWANEEKLSPRLRITPKRLKDRLKTMDCFCDHAKKIAGKTYKGVAGVTLASDAYESGSDTAHRLQDIPKPSTQGHLDHCAKYGVKPEQTVSASGQSDQSGQKDGLQSYEVTQSSTSPHVRTHARTRMGTYPDTRNSVTPLPRNSESADPLAHNPSLDSDFDDSKKKNKKQSNEEDLKDLEQGPVFDPFDDDQYGGDW